MHNFILYKQLIFVHKTEKSDYNKWKIMYVYVCVVCVCCVCACACKRRLLLTAVIQPSDWMPSFIACRWLIVLLDRCFSKYSYQHVIMLNSKQQQFIVKLTTTATILSACGLINSANFSYIKNKLCMMMMWEAVTWVGALYFATNCKNSLCFCIASLYNAIY